ncbi:BnaA05g34940D [Brassica napus]|uniref:BnaA05g34940D protein n=1 Tax=Brassica napus TaxID=3708 RepID=A0A078JI11_BRANA|nr:BnaA05g34940D [Brassica napus]
MLQFWEAEKAQRGDELMGVDMLLFDVKISFHIRYSQPSCQPPQFQGSSPGCGFDITRCNQNFRLSDSLMTILFSDSTNLDVLTEPYSPIPVKRFRNVIGELTAVKSTKLEGFLGDPRVVVASSINPNMHMLVSKAIGITPVPSLLRSYAKVEPLTIAELNEFVFVIISEPQDIEFVCTGMVTDIKLEKGCNTTHQTIAGTSLSGRHQETLGIKVFKGGQEAT